MRRTYHVNRRLMQVQARGLWTNGLFRTIGTGVQLPMVTRHGNGYSDGYLRGFLDPGDVTVYTRYDPAGLVKLFYESGIVCTLRIVLDSFTFRSEAYLEEVGLSRRGLTARFALSGAPTIERTKKRGARYRKRRG